jgi:hypothetical protein
VETTNSSVILDDESGDEAAKDIEIRAEVYKEPSSELANQSETGSNNNSGKSSPITVNGNSFDDKITEIGKAEAGNEKTGSRKGRKNKRKSKH